MKNKFKSITMKIWAYFVCFAIFIFILLWCMQVVFLQTFYSNMKKREIIKLTNTIEEIYCDNDNQEFDILIDRLSFKNNSNILLITKEGNIVYNSNSRIIYMDNRIEKYGPMPAEDILEYILQEKTITHTIKLDKIKSDIFIYGKILKDNNTCVIISTPIDPIDATANILRYQLLYIIIISLVISAFISMFMSKKIAKPIIDINENAKKMANGNFDIEFKGADYNEINDLSDTLNYATKQLKKTDSIRKELIANVSHDLKTPLTMIKAYSEMIKDLYIDNKEKVIDNIDVIINETDRLTNLVNDMMDLSKLESNELSLNIEEFDIIESTNNIINSFISVSEEINLNIKVESVDKLIIKADKTKIERVIYNLISNAINYSNDNKNILIRIEEKHNEIIYSVIDNGKGIDKNDLPYIWNRYYRVDKGYERDNKGTGLGLAIVKNILDLHQAQYGVNSKVGEGSTFWFKLYKENK